MTQQGGGWESEETKFITVRVFNGKFTSLGAKSLVLNALRVRKGGLLPGLIFKGLHCQPLHWICGSWSPTTYIEGADGPWMTWGRASVSSERFTGSCEPLLHQLYLNLAQLERKSGYNFLVLC